MAKIETGIVLSDIHIPYHDVAALKIACAALEDSKPDHVILLGDIADFYSISSHDRDPDRKESFQDEIDSTVEFLEYVKKLSPKSKIYFLEGNHEYRMQRWLWKRGQELNSLRALKVAELLELKRLGIKFYEYNTPMQIGKLVFIHGQYLRSKAGYSAHSGLSGYGSVSYIQGHVHRMAQVYKTDWQGTHAGIENPCLCRLDQEYVGKKATDWQQGFTFIKWFGGGLFHATQHPIFRVGSKTVKCLFNDKVYEEKVKE